MWANILMFGQGATESDGGSWVEGATELCGLDHAAGEESRGARIWLAGATMAEHRNDSATMWANILMFGQGATESDGGSWVEGATELCGLDHAAGEESRGARIWLAGATMAEHRNDSATMWANILMFGQGATESDGGSWVEGATELCGLDHAAGEESRGARIWLAGATMAEHRNDSATMWANILPNHRREGASCRGSIDQALVWCLRPEESRLEPFLLRAMAEHRNDSATGERPPRGGGLSIRCWCGASGDFDHDEERGGLASASEAGDVEAEVLTTVRPLHHLTEIVHVRDGLSVDFGDHVTFTQSCIGCR